MPSRRYFRIIGAITVGYFRQGKGCNMVKVKLLNLVTPPRGLPSGTSGRNLPAYARNVVRRRFHPGAGETP